jgi:hypothetical protein
MGSPTVHCVTPSEYRAHGIKLTWLSANLLANPRFPYTAHRAETLCDILLAPPETAVIGTNRDKSHPDEKRGEQNPSDKPKRNLFLGLLGQGGIVFGDSLGAF